ncbi:hypothetical protein K432DRAFT_295172 [Lepidopterella palustris CBS 459.81]|uniref:PAC domain-containing protein n=1 Tax=Lepidopterella palustris CBS 459.81 TaxID=1314670 RepID=A0A8E2EDH7_9PEZI|nr:hypothetical protein K432DRAFT_295172 [Lepidopterella palustris CBS 459.81]
MDEFADDGATGEPLVQDFQDLHSTKSSEAPDPQTPVHSPPKPLPLESHPVVSSDEETAPPPPDFTRRGIHIPTRTSSRTRVKQRRLRSSSREPSSSMHTSIPNSISTTPESRERSSGDSIISYDTSASSVISSSLPALQSKGPPDEVGRLEPLLEDDPRSFDLLAPNEACDGKVYSLEKRSQQLFSREHLQAIFTDPPSLLRFTSFLSSKRPQSIPVLIYYLDALKAIRAINYANAVAEALEPLDGFDFTQHAARPTVNSVLEDKAEKAFDALVREDLPAYITHIFIQVVTTSIQKRIMGTLPPLLREASEGLAEVFCLTDPSRPDNPIVFASEEFHRTTQYGVSYAIGRNCRFLQGPQTNPSSVERLRAAVQIGKEHSEVFLNYRRDGSPFMNLLMIAPLFDSRGQLRYYIGAQVDVSGMVKDCSDLDAMQRMLNKEEEPKDVEPHEELKDEFQELSEMFNMTELETVRKYGGRMHREQVDDDDDSTIFHARPRLLLKDNSEVELDRPIRLDPKANGRLSGVYKNYLLIRPYPSLRILFSSPSLRVPGILQSPFLSRIGGAPRVREDLADALREGSRGVTARIRWLSTPSTRANDYEYTEEGRKRWIHCTPLLGAKGTVGVWMVVLVDDENDSGAVRRFRTAPPVSKDVRTGSTSVRGDSSGWDGSDDGVAGFRSGSVNRNGFIRHSMSEAFWKPEGSMSQQRSTAPGSSPNSAGGSINSFSI